MVVANCIDTNRWSNTRIIDNGWWTGGGYIGVTSSFGHWCQYSLVHIYTIFKNSIKISFSFGFHLIWLCSFWSRLEMILLSLLIFWMVEFQCLVVLLIQKILLIGIIVWLECEDNNLTHKLIIIRLTQTSKLINYQLLIYFISSKLYFHSEDFVKISRRTDLSNSSELLKWNPQEVLMMMMMSCKRNVVWIDLDSSFNPSWFHDRT